MRVEWRIDDKWIQLALGLQQESSNEFQYLRISLSAMFALNLSYVLKRCHEQYSPLSGDLLRFHCFLGMNCCSTTAKKELCFLLAGDFELSIIGVAAMWFALDSGYESTAKAAVKNLSEQTLVVQIWLPWKILSHCRPLVAEGIRMASGVRWFPKQNQNTSKPFTNLPLATKHGDFSHILRSVSALSRFMVCTDSFCPNCQATGEFSSMPCE